MFVRASLSADDDCFVRGATDKRGYICFWDRYRYAFLSADVLGARDDLDRGESDKGICKGWICVIIIVKCWWLCSWDYGLLLPRFTMDFS